MVAVSTVALAQQTQTALDEQLRSGANVTVSSDETIDGDLYASGGQVRVDGTVNGDLVVAGGQIDVTGDVTGDLLAAGGTITVAGAVDGDARMAGGQIRIDGVIGEDLAVTSGQLVIGAGGLIGDNLLFSTGQTTFGGTVDGSVRGTAGSYESTGTVAGSESVTIPQPEQPTLADRVLSWVRRYIGLLLVGALLLALLPRIARGAAIEARERPVPSLGVGLLGIVGFVAVLIGVILATVVLAIPLGLLRLGGLVAAVALGGALTGTTVVYIFTILVGFVAQAVVALAFGRLLLQPGGEASIGMDIARLALGLLILVLLFAIPLLGGFLQFLAVLLGLGALLLLAWRMFRRPVPAAPPPAPVEQPVA